MFGEDDELPRPPLQVEHLRVLQHVAQLVPLAVNPRLPNFLCHAGQAPEALDLLLQFDHRRRSARQVDDFLRLGLGLLVKVVFKVLGSR